MKTLQLNKKMMKIIKIAKSKIKKVGWTWINDKVYSEQWATGCLSKKDLLNGLGLKAF